MQMKPLVTIAIPAYKATHLAASLRSAVEQTYQETEIIVVNDQSPEDVEMVVKSFNDSRIRYHKNERNLGKNDPSRNWNECLRRARGEWFCLLCDDDQYAPSFLETMMQLSVRYPECNVLRSGVSVIDGEGRETSRYPTSPEFETIEEYMWALFHGQRRQTISEFLLRRQTVRQAGGYVNLPYAWGSDNLSIFRFGLQGGIASTSLPLTVFRDSGENISSDGRNMDEKLKAFRQYMQAAKDMVRNEGFRTDLYPVIDDYYRRACVDHIVEADAEALRHIIADRRSLEIPTGSILRALLKRWPRCLLH